MGSIHEALDVVVSLELQAPLCPTLALDAREAINNQPDGLLAVGKAG